MYRPINAGIGYTSNYSQSRVQTRTIEEGSKPINKYKPLTGGPVRRQRVIEESLLKKDVLTPIVRVTELPPATVEQRAVLVKQPDGSYKSDTITSQRNNQPSDKLLMLHQPAPSSMRHRSLVAPPKLGVFDGDWGDKDAMANFLIRVGVFSPTKDVSLLPKALLRDKIVMYNSGLQQGGGVDIPTIRDTPETSEVFLETNPINAGTTHLQRFQAVGGNAIDPNDLKSINTWISSANVNDIEAVFREIFKSPITGKQFAHGEPTPLKSGDMRRALYTVGNLIITKKVTKQGGRRNVIPVYLSTSGRSAKKGFAPVANPFAQGSAGNP